MSEQTLEIKLLENAEEMALIVTMFQQVWGAVIPVVGVEMLRAIAHSGGYVAGAFDSGRIVGASVGFLARHEGEDALHSHVTGILPGATGSGVGRAMKNHQRAWAADQRLKWVTWTFDPLVRRNAWFNIEVLRAHVADYLVDFYGPMTDSINAHDESDRLMVAWPTDPTATTVTTNPDARQVEVPTPEDIVVIRRTDPAASREWRLRLREELGERMHGGAVVTGFTRAGAYIVHEAVRVRIREVELRRIGLPLVVPFRTSFGTETERDVLLIRVTGDDGPIGWGECVAQAEPTYSAEYVDAAALVIQSHLLPRLVAAGDVAAAEIAALLRPVKGHPMAKAALEMAVLDAELRRAAPTCTPTSVVPATGSRVASASASSTRWTGC